MQCKWGRDATRLAAASVGDLVLEQRDEAIHLGVGLLVLRV